MKFSKILMLGLGCALVFGAWSDVSAFGKKKKSKVEATAKKPAPTPYEKLFKDVKSHSAKGLVTLHKIDGKVYFEFPVKLLGRQMLLGSSVESTSDNGESIIGQKPHYPLHIVFTQIDSTVQIRYVYRNSVTSNEVIEKAIVKNNLPAILHSFPIKAVSPDSSAVVFDATEFFVSDLEDIDPFDPYGANTYYGWMARTSKFKKELSFIGDVDSFEDNFSVSSHLSYGVSYHALGMFLVQSNLPFTAVMRRTFMLLPEEPMRPRLADPRIGIFFTGQMRFEEFDNGMKPEYYANHWRVEPKDVEAWKRGELVDPIKPIVFYIDNNFPAKWQKHIKEGVEEWNAAFEKIGFRNAVQTRPFPTDDPEFSTNNLKYSCIMYASSPTENAMGPSWVDPRTGEILNASVYIYHNLVSLLYNWRFIQTAAADKSVRTINLPDEVMGDAIRYVTSHEVGHCFGFMHNMAASAAYPVDSLRSPSFTQKYGTTPSIMDYARFNYVAQPGDVERGVRLTPPALGPYDLYAVKWLYQPIPEAATARDEVATLSKWISEKGGDPIYRYGKQQIRSFYDPSSQTEDLGDDAVKASDYGIRNLKYIMANMNDWFEAEDLDGTFRDRQYYNVIQQLRMYMGHMMNNLGGIYLSERYVGDPQPTYQCVSKAKQKATLQYLLALQNDLDWLDNETLTKQLPIVGPVSDFMKNSVMSSLVRYASEMELCSLKSDDPYTEMEYMNDIIDFVMKPATKGTKLTDIDRKNQLALLSAVIKETNLPAVGEAPKKGITDYPFAWLDAKIAAYEGYRPDVDPVSGFGYQRRIRLEAMPDKTYLYYGTLLNLKNRFTVAMARADKESADHYRFMLSKIDQILRTK